jgi:hypothetical protein
MVLSLDATGHQFNSHVIERPFGHKV